MEIRFNSILLETEQEDLLSLLIEAVRNTPRDKHRKFIVDQSHSGDSLIHPGLKNGANIYYGDVEELERQGLVAIGFSSTGSPNFDVTSQGYRYYEHLKSKKGESIHRIETTIREHINSLEFQNKYPEAFLKWSQAEESLWHTDTQKQLTTIGHLCREALQGFTNILVERHKPSDVNPDITKTIQRLKTVLETVIISEKKKDLLIGLLTYWNAVNGIVQRQEHGAYKDGEQIIWEDARRVVFQTMIIMFEIDKIL